MSRAQRIAQLQQQHTINGTLRVDDTATTLLLTLIEEILETELRSLNLDVNLEGARYSPASGFQCRMTVGIKSDGGLNSYARSQYLQKCQKFNAQPQWFGVPFIESLADGSKRLLRVAGINSRAYSTPIILESLDEVTSEPLARLKCSPEFVRKRFEAPESLAFRAGFPLVEIDTALAFPEIRQALQESLFNSSVRPIELLRELQKFQHSRVTTRASRI